MPGLAGKDEADASRGGRNKHVANCISMHDDDAVDVKGVMLGF
jgi:hypothetical protein